MEFVALRKGVKGLFGRASDDGYLIAAHRIDEPPTLNDSLRADEYEIDLVHDVRYGRIEDDCTWDTSSDQSLGCFQAKSSRTSLCHEDRYPLAFMSEQ